MAEKPILFNRPLDDDANVLLNRCAAQEPLSLEEQRELYLWLEERGRIIGDLEEQIERLEGDMEAKNSVIDELRLELSHEIQRCNACGYTGTVYVLCPSCKAPVTQLTNLASPATRIATQAPPEEESDV